MATPASASRGRKVANNNSRVHREHEKQDDVRTANIEAAKAVADTVRTSLGPMGMDKMVCVGVSVFLCGGIVRAVPLLFWLSCVLLFCAFSRGLLCDLVAVLFSCCSVLCSQIVHPSGEVTTTNDGATLLSQMKLVHPTAKMVRQQLSSFRFSFLFALLFRKFVVHHIMCVCGVFVYFTVFVFVCVCLSLSLALLLSLGLPPLVG
jgi:hypothetical protein